MSARRQSPGLHDGHHGAEPAHASIAARDGSRSDVSGTPVTAAPAARLKQGDGITGALTRPALDAGQGGALLPRSGRDGRGAALRRRSGGDVPRSAAVADRRGGCPRLRSTGPPDALRAGAADIGRQHRG